MANTQKLVGVQHKEGEFLNERTRSMQKYNNLLLFRTEEFDEEDVAYGLRALPELKVKVEDFEEMSGVSPEKFLANLDEYVGKKLRVYYDEKGKPIEIRFFEKAD